VTDLSIPELLQARAARLGVRVVVINPDEHEFDETDLGPFRLVGAAEGYDVWVGGLPIEGIVAALNCFEREVASGNTEASWQDFGTGNWPPFDYGKANRRTENDSRE
jgi:hypothetical protein